MFTLTIQNIHTISEEEERSSYIRMACIERASPALKQILLKLCCAEKPLEIDHHLYEFGSVEYHIQSQASNPQVAYLSISMPPLCHGVIQNELSSYTIEMVKGLCPNVVGIAEPAKEGYQLTLKLNLNQIPQNKDYDKVIKEISTVHSVILSSQLKEILWNVNFDDALQGMYKPIKLVYHPKDHFFLIRQPQRIIAVFPIRFREKSDVIIATAFFQELVDVGSSDKWAKVPPCNWSAIPPPELRGEAFEDLSTNGGFFTFDISSRHVEGNRLDKTVWNLLNFNAYVRYHVKSTKGFIQRRMRKRLESLVEVLHQTNLEENEQTKQHQVYRYTKKLVRSAKYAVLKQRWGTFGRKIKRIRFRLKIHGFTRFRQQWFRFPKFSTGYTKIVEKSA
ncbi:actin-related protein 2/3 complex subunit 2B isoform X1 [Glycine soja]|uniref:Arp2/3 complex 34 kDa subunit n=4 Tax=Glycine subgen. Soja TaxID=1462606 RepID=K7LJ90_SOYBN|nr:actin-related protein 2/3 complex subunit 2B isoform X1 [Glycine max]XP_028183436.1 actin-related protein 2/3 complex subunit 2B isoform X1 [Glycine soja]KHN48465.1 Putative actin-related protein 2/3 complex subunit 2 [Glycine soja]|eukprot:XP_003535288.2 actin-related protein 2/3 complex subunit 2B [Glycine max]